jgi:hypothetical protein
VIVLADLLAEAREHDPTFTEERHPRKVLLAHLSSYVRELGGKMLTRYPNSLPPVVALVSLPVATFEAGFTLPEVGDPALPPDVYRIRTTWALDREGHRLRCPIIGELSIGAIHEFPSLFHRGRTFYQTGVERDWNGFTGIEITYTPIMGGIAVGATTLALPGDAMNALVTRLTSYMAIRAPETSGELRRYHRALHADAEQAFLERVQQWDDAVISRTREVY